jgi:hypothetical protein
VVACSEVSSRDRWFELLSSWWDLGQDAEEVVTDVELSESASRHECLMKNERADKAVGQTWDR